jgi:hypothetical protein
LVKFFDADLGSEIRDAKIRIRDLGWKKFRSEIRDKHPGSATLKERHSLMLIFNLLIHVYVKDCLLYHSQNAFFFRCQHWFESGRKELC